jgi:hypothetical protein
MRKNQWRRIFFPVFSFLILIVTRHVVYATTYLVPGTTISVYAQSTAESSAHLIRSSEGIYNNGQHPWCGDRAYILFADKELFATALAASLSGKPVNFIYEDAAEVKVAAGHIVFGCKVISIWW